MDKSFYWFLWSKFIQFVILFIWCANSVNSYCDSYPENYSERTLHHKLKDDQQKKVIQNQILNLFGLKERPNLTSERNKRRSNSNYLNAIYNQYNVLKDVNLSPSDLNRTKESQMNLSNFQAIEDSDVIISFDSQISSNLSTETTQIFRFNISRAYAYDKVIRSELVFYQSRLNPTRTNLTADLETELGTNLTDSRTVSNLNATNLQTNQTNNNPAAQLRTIRNESTSPDIRFSIQVNVKSSLHNVTLNYTLTKSISNEDSWVKMDFTNIFKELLYDRQKEFNLEISSFLVTDHQQVVRSWSVADFVDEASKPLVVSYFKLNANLHEQNRIKRDLVNSQISSETKFTNHRRLLKRTSQRRTCQLNSFFISFKELGWQDWIIAPEGYSSFFCSGQCLFPLKESTNATNHAIIQSLMQVLNPQNYPKPCCAAIKFSSVDLLLVTEDQAVMWKRYKKMVPRACGCV